MKCRDCEETAHSTKVARGLCLGHALLFLCGPWVTVEEFLLRRKA